jgi:hypothetical protein
MSRNMLHLLLGSGLAIYPGTRPQESPAKPPVSHPDTVRAGDPIVAANRPHAFTLVRHLTLTKGDSVRPFGRQTEALSRTTLDGKPVLLDVLVFDTPNGKTIDSSWVDGRTLRPLRFRSHTASRVVRLDFEGINQRLGVHPFEWNVFGLAVAALPLHQGYEAIVPVYSDRSGRVAWYAVEVLGDTVLTITGGTRVPVWEVLAKADSTAPTARFWITQRDRMVDRVLVSEPGVSILYARR